MDILAELRENQYLLEVLDRTIGDAYFDADDDTTHIPYIKEEQRK